MNVRQMMSEFQDFLKEKYPEIELWCHEDPTVFYQRATFTSFESRLEVVMKLQDEQMVCAECAKLTSPSNTLVPVVSKDDQEVSISCCHMLPFLKYWRAMTDEEHEDYVRESIFEDFQTMLVMLEAKVPDADSDPDIL